MRLATRDWISFFIGVTVALVLTTLVIDRTDTVQRHVCESNQQVREPLLHYISNELRLVNEAKRQHIPLGPPKLQPIQDASFKALSELDHALKTSIVTGCSE